MDILLDRPLVHRELTLISIVYVNTLVRAPKYYLRGKRISLDNIFGALSVYLMLGLTWAWIFTMPARYDPDSFTGALRIPPTSSISAL